MVRRQSGAVLALVYLWPGPVLPQPEPPPPPRRCDYCHLTGCTDQRRCQFDSPPGTIRPRKQEQELLAHLLGPTSGYDTEIAPVVSAAVSISSTLTHIVEFDTSSRTMTLNMYFRQAWHDERLQWNFNELGIGDGPGTNLSHLVFAQAQGAAMSSRLWKPDTFFSNAVREESRGEEFIILCSTGAVVWSRRAVVKYYCAMDFTAYPLDIQVCYIDLEAYGYTYGTLSINPPEPDETYSSALSIDADQNQHDCNGLCAGVYQLGTVRGRDWEVVQGYKNYGSRTYPFIRWVLRFDRSIDLAVVQIFVPSILVTGISFLGLWLDPDDVTRFGTSVTALLVTLVNQHRARDGIPKTASITMIDGYLMFLLSCVIINMVMYVVSLALLLAIKRAEYRLKGRQDLKDKVQSTSATGDNDSGGDESDDELLDKVASFRGLGQNLRRTQEVKWSARKKNKGGGPGGGVGPTGILSAVKRSMDDESGDGSPSRGRRQSQVSIRQLRHFTSTIKSQLSLRKTREYRDGGFRVDRYRPALSTFRSPARKRVTYAGTYAGDEKTPNSPAVMSPLPECEPGGEVPAANTSSALPSHPDLHNPALPAGETPTMVGTVPHQPAIPIATVPDAPMINAFNKLGDQGWRVWVRHVAEELDASDGIDAMRRSERDAVIDELDDWMQSCQAVNAAGALRKDRAKRELVQWMEAQDCTSPGEEAGLQNGESENPGVVASAQCGNPRTYLSTYVSNQGTGRGSAARHDAEPAPESRRSSDGTGLSRHDTGTHAASPRARQDPAAITRAQYAEKNIDEYPRQSSMWKRDADGQVRLEDSPASAVLAPAQMGATSSTCSPSAFQQVTSPPAGAFSPPTCPLTLDPPRRVQSVFTRPGQAKSMPGKKQGAKTGSPTPAIGFQKAGNLIMTGQRMRRIVRPPVRFADAQVGMKVLLTPHNCTPGKDVFSCIIMRITEDSVRVRYDDPGHGGPPPRLMIPKERAEHMDWWDSGANPRLIMYQVDENRYLPPKLRAELLDAFQNFDVDHSGTISLFELAPVLKASGLSEDECVKVLKRFDEDGNGRLDFEEFVALMQDHCNAFAKDTESVAVTCCQFNLCSRLKYVKDPATHEGRLEIGMRISVCAHRLEQTGPNTKSTVGEIEALTAVCWAKVLDINDEGDSNGPTSSWTDKIWFGKGNSLKASNRTVRLAFYGDCPAYPSPTQKEQVVLDVNKGAARHHTKGFVFEGLGLTRHQIVRLEANYTRIVVCIFILVNIVCIITLQELGKTRQDDMWHALLSQNTGGTPECLRFQSDGAAI